ncbi:hypothetical protein MUK42_13491 [Musa troglodytarum]|nr:hypothetical protein MUK42_13491 [Musa troglodytarum]
MGEPDEGGAKQVRVRKMRERRLRHLMYVIFVASELAPRTSPTGFG